MLYVLYYIRVYIYTCAYHRVYIYNRNTQKNRHTRTHNIKWVSKYQNSKSSSYKLFLIGTFFSWGNRLLSLIFFLRRASLIKYKEAQDAPSTTFHSWDHQMKFECKIIIKICWWSLPVLKSGFVRVSMLCFTMFIVYFIFEK